MRIESLLLFRIFQAGLCFLRSSTFSGQVWEVIIFSYLTALPEAADQEGSEKEGETESGSAARICKITEPHCQGSVSVFVIQLPKKSLCVWLRSNGMLTQPWSCLSNIIRLDKRSKRGASSVPLKAILLYMRPSGVREMLTVEILEPIF